MNTISTITICFNNLSELIDTCLSVEGLTVPPDEHIIIDGSNNEEIVNWLENNKQPNYRKWIHERDNGISDAFNKGITNSRSDILHILNSGDKYYDKAAIEIVKNLFENDLQLMWVHSQYVQYRGGVYVISGEQFEKEKLWRGMRTVAHPTMFIRKEVYKRQGLYNEDFKIAMDYDLLVKIRNEKNQFIPKPLIFFAPGGASNLQFQKGLQEVRRIYNSHVGISGKLVFWQLRQKLLYYFMETKAGKIWFQIKNRKQISS